MSLAKPKMALALVLVATVSLGAVTVAPPGASGTPAPPGYSIEYGPNSIQGDVFAVGVGVRADGTGTLNANALPSNADVVLAYAYWVQQNWNQDGPSPGDETLDFDGTTLTGTVIGTDSGLCWGQNGWAHGLRADVTALVPGPGSYDVEVASSATTLADGVSLLVLYTIPSAPWREIVVVDGYDSLTPLGSPPVAQSLTVNIPRTTGMTQASSRLIAIGADGQTVSGYEPSDSMTWNGAALASGSWQGSDPMTTSSPDGSLSDTDLFQVTSIKGTNTLGIEASSDCIGPQAFALSSPGTPPVPPPTPPTPPGPPSPLAGVSTKCYRTLDTIVPVSEFVPEPSAISPSDLAVSPLGPYWETMFTHLSLNQGLPAGVWQPQYEWWAGGGIGPGYGSGWGGMYGQWGGGVNTYFSMSASVPADYFGSPYGTANNNWYMYHGNVGYASYPGSDLGGAISEVEALYYQHQASYFMDTTILLITTGRDLDGIPDLPANVLGAVGATPGLRLAVIHVRDGMGDAVGVYDNQAFLQALSQDGAESWYYQAVPTESDEGIYPTAFALLYSDLMDAWKAQQVADCMYL